MNSWDLLEALDDFFILVDPATMRIVKANASFWRFFCIEPVQLPLLPLLTEFSLENCKNDLKTGGRHRCNSLIRISQKEIYTQIQVQVYTKDQSVFLVFHAREQTLPAFADKEKLHGLLEELCFAFQAVCSLCPANSHFYPVILQAKSKLEALSEWLCVSFLEGKKIQVLQMVEDSSHDSGSSLSKEAVIVRSSRILVVEDNRLNVQVLKQLFKNTEYELDFAQNGREGVDFWQKEEYLAILMDLQMPVMNGFEATKEIRRLEKELKRPRIPIAAISANLLQEDQAICLKAGMDAFFQKPVQRALLFQFLETLPKNGTK